MSITWQPRVAAPAAEADEFKQTQSINYTQIKIVHIVTESRI